MADVLCKRCGEPWELDYVDHDGFTEEERKDFWNGRRCPACTGGYHNNESDRPFAVMAMSALHDILGDDHDAIAAELEDLEMIGGLD